MLFLDAPTGLAGDMIIAALVDLGVPREVVEQAAGALELEGFELRWLAGARSGIAATRFDVVVSGAQPERTYRDVDARLAGAPLDEPTRALARKIFRRLAEAEAEVHAAPLDDVHFHEVGAVDALIDVVGAAAALTYLGATLVVSPLPMGGGRVVARHGVLPLPAPATVLCLRGVPTYGVDVDKELVTPTGAAIVATAASSFERWPTFSPEHVGWGAGARELVDRPNLLRAVLGEPAAPSRAAYAKLDANVDDLTGELAGHAIERLLASGALDAWASPLTMKKGRPGWTLSALCRDEDAGRLAGVMLTETSTLGVRRAAVTRVERPRRIVEVETPFGRVPVKIGEGAFGPPTQKPEFDVCRRLAEERGVPVREVIAAALRALG